MGNVCQSICGNKVDETPSEDAISHIDELEIRKKQKEFVCGLVESKDKFSEYVDLKKFAYHYGKTIKHQKWLSEAWKGIELPEQSREFKREKINEPVFIQHKYIIRKGVPLDQVRSYIQKLFGIELIKTDIEYELSLKQVSTGLDLMIVKPPTFGPQKDLEKVLVHHVLTPEGLRVGCFFTE